MITAICTTTVTKCSPRAASKKVNQNYVMQGGSHILILHRNLAGFKETEAGST